MRQGIDSLSSPPKFADVANSRGSFNWKSHLRTLPNDVNTTIL